MDKEQLADQDVSHLTEEEIRAKIDLTKAKLSVIEQVLVPPCFSVSIDAAADGLVTRGKCMV